jgi:chromate transporter
VVRVILNLAIVFGLAVVLPAGLTGGINWFGLVLSVAAFVALYNLKVDVLRVIMISGLVGLLRSVLS